VGRLDRKAILLIDDQHGLARAAAAAFAREGARVALAVRGDSQEVAGVRLVKLDPRDAASCEAGIHTAAEALDGLDVLCTAYPTVPAQSRLLHELNGVDWDETFAETVTAVVLPTRFALRVMKARGGGAIIALGSSAGLVGVPLVSAYSAGNGLLTNWTRNIAMEGEPQGIRANLVCLGHTWDPLVPSLAEVDGRRVFPEEITPILTFLASDESRHLTGQVLPADDGLSAWRDRRTERVGAPRDERIASLKARRSTVGGEVALISAGGGAIGRATALRLGGAGVRIVAADLDPSAAEATAAAIRECGGEAVAVAGDILNGDDCQRIVGLALEQFGGLHILCNLVGYFGPRGSGQMDEIDLDRWDWMMDINLKSAFMLSRQAIPAMLRSGGGSIVNTGTLAALIARGGIAYGASKSGVLGLTRGMAAEYQPYGIRVNCVCPSATDTPMYWGAGAGNRRKEDVAQTAQGLSTPEQIADAFFYLATDVSARVTGHILVADNGFSGFRQ
jgi:NAD(P)-dependent dehydrogenase (short-subunit alcohol dehydrogenase family)